MEGRAKLVLIPNYSGNYTPKIDDRNRLKLPEMVRRTMAERNRYNIMTEEFHIIPYFGNGYAMAFKGIPFARIETEKDVTKEDLDVSSIDDIVYISAGIIKNDLKPRPDFIFINPTTVFIYSSTDAQRMLYDDSWKDCGFSLRHQTVSLDEQGRIQLKKAFDEFEYLRNIVIDSENRTCITGQPLLFCVTLTKPT